MTKLFKHSGNEKAPFSFKINFLVLFFFFFSFLEGEEKFNLLGMFTNQILAENIVLTAHIKTFNFEVIIPYSEFPKFKEKIYESTCQKYLLHSVSSVKTAI